MGDGSKCAREYGAPIKAWTIMYKVVVQAVLLYGSERWGVTDSTMAVSEVFHKRISGRITRMMARRGDVGE